MSKHPELVDSRSGAAGFPWGSNLQNRRRRQEYSLFLLSLFRELAKERKRVPFCELQAELMKRGWHP